MARSPVNGELFGAPPPAPPRDNTPVTLPMIELPNGTDMAWLLSPDGRSKEAKFAPRSLVTRGEGRDARMFTMPRWVAKERGWL